MYTTVLNGRSKKEQDILRRKANRLEADAMYEKVRNKRVEFEEVLTEFTLLDKKIQENNGEVEDTDQSQYTGLLLKSKIKYSLFYNEIEAFCNRLVDKTIESEEYINNEVLPSLKKDAMRQVMFFGTLNEKAKMLSLPPIPKPEPTAFKNFNTVINQYFGDDTHWISELERVRNEKSFVY
ncbi:hypothetical protein [Cohnella thailandensis]|uniref:Uncharacterized protein n=1 Tax=Cohnella thailandensis TaxID=557557 RepID=A0A841SPW5_9BACL|nr:hypothetical protein [Cohnella thailandensis]MBB6633242.1 hypothetical protein [Cohnella thailandensis]MBP1975060.1 hypothetical protein [Cohnella thailandensis]